MIALLLAAQVATAQPSVPLKDWGKTFTKEIDGPVTNAILDVCSPREEQGGEAACLAQGAPDECGRGCILWQTNCGQEYVGFGQHLVHYECIWHTPPLLPPFGGTPRPMYGGTERGLHEDMY